MKYDPREVEEGLERRNSFVAWQPSSWPPPNPDPILFSKNLRIIFEDSVLEEIGNVISDAEKVHGDIQHRGHVIALALFCAVDMFSSYAFNLEKEEICECCGRGEKIGPRYRKFIEEFFPDDYKPYAEALYTAYRNNLVHSWNLFEVTIAPGHEHIQQIGSSVLVGLLNFYDALQISVENFLNRLESDPALQKQAVERYSNLQRSATS